MIEQQILKTVVDKRSVLQIFCLGVFHVIRPGEDNPIGIVSKHKMWLLFKYLITHKGSVIPTQRIIDLLWPDYQDPSDTAILRTTISRLKSLLEPKRTSYRKSSYLIYCKDSCAFNLHTSYWLDIEEFENLTNLAHRLGPNNRKTAIELYLQALELYQGDFLAEDLDLEWAVIPREHYRRLYIDSASELASWLIDGHEFSKAYHILKTAVKIDPYAENLHILLMRALLGMGELKTAAEHYTYYSTLLYKELGVKPSAEWKRLYKQMRETGSEDPNKLILEGEWEKYISSDSGPFICEPDFFWSFLLLERRRLARNGGESSLVVLEVTKTSSFKNVTNKSEEGLEYFEAKICQKLRRSDIVCKLDEYHWALFLSATGSEGSSFVIAQIKEFFTKHFAASQYLLNVKIRKVTST